MATTSIVFCPCGCGLEIDKVPLIEILSHARKACQKILGEWKMQNETKTSWQYGVAFNKIQSFFQRKATCPLADCKQYVEAHTMIECVQHLKSYLNSIELEGGQPK
ncbi:MAG: hypothetical protein KGH89_07785 [Thaumarchaeota archaeon]|nr:hypothetical protein [Nitrososphaerota archaeon]MDE1867731.1 hypothetical protein [Nitrososphaerota archaeon]